jgi:DNA-binding transcriptional LysR family regulator
VEVGQAETAFTFVAAGAGIAVIDPVSAYNNRGAGIVIRRFEPAVHFDIWLIRPKVVRPFNLIDAALEFMLQRLKEFAHLCELLPGLPMPDHPPSLTETFSDLLRDAVPRS